MLQVKVNEKSVFEIDHSKDKFDWDIQKIADGYYHILKDHRSYNLYILDHDPHLKHFRLRINGNDYDIKIKDQYDLLLKKLGLSEMVQSKINQIKAPMPGLVLEVIVKEGDPVSKGDQILILEAMKMENIIKSPGDGVVRRVKIRKGDAVEKNEMLIELE